VEGGGGERGGRRGGKRKRMMGGRGRGGAGRLTQSKSNEKAKRV
jgi:hypothetical protein